MDIISVREKQQYFEDADGLFADNPPEWESSIYFDLFPGNLKPFAGECILDRLDNVEDTKGNNGLKGVLMITNIRLIWYSSKSMYVNLSIGLNVINGTNIKQASSKLMGACQALHVYASKNNSNFEFIFTHLVPNTPRMFSTALSAIKAFQSSRLYREMRIKGSFISGKNLNLFPDELLDETISGVWNLSSEQGHLGAFILTNIRIVWYSLMNETFNMSLPFRQIIGIRSQNSKYGRALVLETSESSGKYILGFRIDPPSKLDKLTKNIIKMWKITYENPIFGVKMEVAEEDKEPKERTIHYRGQQNDIKIVDEQKEYLNFSQTDSHHRYMQSLPSEAVGDLVFDPILGLAMERIPEGMTLNDLWNKI